MNVVCTCCCPICAESVKAKTTIENYDDRFGYKGVFKILHCQNCGHRFIASTFTSEMLLDIYSNYYPRSNYDLEKYKPHEKSSSFSTWLKGEMYSPFLWVTPAARVLDIGCGFGESLGYLQSLNCNAYGVEADENIRRVAEMFGYKVKVGLFDAADYDADFFDFVTLGQVIEHITDPVRTMHDIATVLKPGGLLIMSTPNADGWGKKLFGKRWVNWHTPYHLQIFSEKSMRIAAEKSGLKLEAIESITPSEWLHAQWMHLLTLPNEGEPSIFWIPKERWSRKQKVARFCIFLLHKLRINHILTRLFDAVHLGDNRVYFLRKP